MFRKIVLSSVTIAALSFGSAAHAAEKPGYNAFGALTPFDTQVSVQSDSAQISKSRASALVECSGVVAGRSQSMWGVQQGALFRACMAERGQPE